MFNNGESSLFMVNAREMNYIGARIQLLDIQVKNAKSVLGASYAAGILGN